MTPRIRVIPETIRTGTNNSAVLVLLLVAGCDGTRYSGNRAAAPFAVLHAIYSSMRLVLSVDPAAIFGPLDAFTGIVLDNPVYCDTGPAGSTSGFGIGAEEGFYDAQGWYDEISVVRFIYDLWDDNDEGGDTGSIGFQPIYDVMTGPQVSTETFTSIFSFAAAPRRRLSPADQDFLDAQLIREDMTPVLDGPDIYVADLREFRYADPNSPATFPNRMCFDVSMTPVP